MRHSRSVWSLALILAGVALVHAQAQTPATDVAAAPAAEAAAPADAAAPAAEDPAHNELRKLRAEMEAALNKGDLDGLLAHVDDTIVFTAMNAQTGHGKQGIRDYFNKMMTGDKRIVQSVKMDLIPDGLSTLLAPDVALSSGSAPAHYVLTNGMDFEITARWTATLVRREGQWFVAAFHYSTNMFKNPVLDMQRKWLLIAGGGAAIVLGLLGYFLGRRSGRAGGAKA